MKYLAIPAFLLLAQPAFAHAMLEHADPAAGAVLAKAPQKVVLSFSETLEPTFTRVEVKAADGASVAAAAAVVKDRTIRLTLKPLSAGSYRVSWHAVSLDTHRTQGTYSFTVKP